MAPIETKQKILDASLQLFNENGIINVRLQQIADETGISVGNLAYHYNNKEAITESLITNVISLLRELLKDYGKYNSLRDIDFFFKEYYDISNQYKFFIFDILEIKRNFPVQYETVQPIINKIRLQVERRIELCIQLKLIQKEANAKSMASNIMLLMFFMHEEGQLNGKATLTANQYRRRLWDFIHPYFTTMGNAYYTNEIEPELVGK